ncbi:MAG: thiamine phosphate synthase [Acidobacteriota bacterium]
MNWKLSRLYPIIDVQLNRRPLEELVQSFAAAGLSLVQLRAKHLSSREFLAQAHRLVELSRPLQLKVVVNDRADIAWLSRADGVHLGQDDLSVEDARTILGPQAIVGISTHSLEQAWLASQTSADYVAIGPVFETRSKEKPDPVVSCEVLSQLRCQVPKPLVAIGGITAERAPDLFRIGIDSVAVIRDVLCASDLDTRIADYLSLKPNG